MIDQEQLKPQSTKPLQYWKCVYCGKVIAEVYLVSGSALLKKCQYCKGWNLLEKP
jgi:phage FluMu protein Com